MRTGLASLADGEVADGNATQVAGVLNTGGFQRAKTFGAVWCA